MTQKRSNPGTPARDTSTTPIAAADPTCPAGRCAFGEVCVCNWYLARGWHCAPFRRNHPRPSRAPTGIRASGFREGFAHGGADALRRIWALIPTEHRAEVEQIAASYTAGAYQ
jgi:hypothetical protein